MPLLASNPLLQRIERYCFHPHHCGASYPLALTYCPRRRRRRHFIFITNLMSPR